MPSSTRNSTPQRRLVPIKDAARQASVHPMTIRRWIAEGHLPGYRLGPRALRIDLNELDAMLRPIPAAGGSR